ncbi:hypothetical protein BC793_12069 [Actinoplanes xinjiangensis]|uniref:EamA-like transporter family protein n=2 Tax=Actinoplanes xinjiangensis TaxID=512350 RepID=A0A316F6S5_9ACTN|nr:hypothetical protein BC793_12069 [Actinoplanes xinjiangensis]GIF42445.1 multidrug DMT transporter permease [Actinoplanes xinjiangensis]
MLPVGALILVLASAFVHALWNVLFARASRGIAGLAVTNAAGFVLWAPVAFARWRIETPAWPYLLVNAAFQAYYLLVLNRAYARAPAHTVYPVARGLGPVLVLAAAAAAAGGVHLSWWAVVAVGLISAGVWLTVTGTVDRRVFAAAFPVAISLAAYPFVAAHGLRYADPATYLWLSLAPLTAGTLAIALVTARTGLRAEIRPATIVTGAGMVTAGGLAMAALAMATPAQVPAIAALRETGILFMVPLSWLISRTFSGRVALGAVVVFAGVAVLAVR